MSQSVQELILRRCVYWLSLRGAVPTTAQASMRITIPGANVFSAETLESILQRLQEGGMP